MVVIGLDIGGKRCGIALSDDRAIIASGHSTVDSKDLDTVVDELIAAYACNKIVMGYPVDLKGNKTNASQLVIDFIARTKSRYPHINFVKWDERFTSKMAMRTLVDSNVSKKKRRNKALLDEISASLILQNYLDNANR